jgi:hypothetical protein
MDLRERVFAALNRAKDNGTDWTEDDPGEVAAYLLANDGFDNLRDDEEVDLQDYIIEWQESFLI